MPSDSPEPTERFLGPVKEENAGRHQPQDERPRVSRGVEEMVDGIVRHGSGNYQGRDLAESKSVPPFGKLGYEEAGMDESKKSPMAPYVVPFALFMAGLALVEAVRYLGGKSGALLLSKPEFWVYPLQTLACGAALIVYWRRYDFGRGVAWLAALAAGLLALGLWLLPTALPGVAPRTAGFDPTPFSDSPLLYWLTIAARFARLVIIVPLVEEIFWRGFLMRYLIREDFSTIPLGTYSRLSFFGVAGLFMFVHSMPDWPAAFLTGIIYNGLLVRTKSLGACVVAHAVTNLGLGIYIMVTRQWGFW